MKWNRENWAAVRIYPGWWYTITLLCFMGWGIFTPENNIFIFIILNISSLCLFLIFHHLPYKSVNLSGICLMKKKYPSQRFGRLSISMSVVHLLLGTFIGTQRCLMFFTKSNWWWILAINCRRKCWFMKFWSQEENKAYWHPASWDKA